MAYVPALQNKAGELAALANASDEVWKSTVPLLQFVGPKDKTRVLGATSVREWVKKAHFAIGEHPVYVDFVRLDPGRSVKAASGDLPVAECIYAAARKRGMQFMPVVLAGESSAEHLNLAGDAAATDGNGLAIRYRLREIVPRPGVPDFLSVMLTDLGVDASVVDLIFDLGYLSADDELDASDVVEAIATAAGGTRWRSLVLIGSSIPAMMTSVTEGTVGAIPRREWGLWQDISASGGLKQRVVFGDYAIQHPQPPADGGAGMRANIRYTINGETLVARGTGPVVEEGKEQYRQLCKKLTTDLRFSGPAFSWGDKLISDCSVGLRPPGAQGMWRGAGTSHHLRFVTRQLLPAMDGA